MNYENKYDYYSDLSPCDYFEASSSILIAVGWLDPRHGYSKGVVEATFFNKLVDLLINAWQPEISPGRHPCGFCRYTGGPTSLRFGEKHIQVGTYNLFVPGNKGVFVAPSLITHYIDAHEYCPPMEFMEAVLRCPEMKSSAYLNELRDRGLGEFL